MLFGGIFRLRHIATKVAVAALGRGSRSLRNAIVCLTVILPASFPMIASAWEPLAKNTRTIMIYGDSLSASYGIDPRRGWVSLLQEKLKSEGVNVVNASVSGETTSGGLARIGNDLKNIRPTIVVIELGANDGLRGLKIADMQQNLQAIIAKTLAAKVKVILVGVQIPPNYGLDYAQQFRETYATLATKNKIILVPFLLEGFADKLELFQADRVHPTAAAQPTILDNMLPAIRQAMGKTLNAKPQKAISKQ